MSGIIKDRFCRKCQDWIRFDDYFGYCKRFDCQARHDDTCNTVHPNIKGD